MGTSDVEAAAALRALLKHRGWEIVKGMAVHSRLEWPWPLADADRLEREADDGDSRAQLLLER